MDKFTEDMRVRVTPEMKASFGRLLKKRHGKKESELARDAMVEYLQRNGELQDDPAPPRAYPKHQPVAVSLNDKVSSNPSKKHRNRDLTAALKKDRQKAKQDRDESQTSE